MTATSIANIDQVEAHSRPEAKFDGDANPVPGAGQATEIQAEAARAETGIGKPESELGAEGRRHGLTLKELAARMGVSAGYLSMVSNGRRPWTQGMQEKVAAVLGEVPGQGVVYRQGGVVSGESSYIREQARTLGMSMRDLAERAGVGCGYMSDVSRGRRNMGVAVQARVEAALEAPAKVAPAQRASVDPEALWDRMEAHGIRCAMSLGSLILA